MKRRRPEREGVGPQDDLFSVDPTAHLMYALEATTWPAHELFPFNRARAQVRLAGSR